MNETLEHMSIDDIIEHVTALGGVLTLQPQPGDGSPEISWGDVFFYYAPDGEVPSTQPFATIVTKDYPDEPASGLDRTEAFRLNIAASAAESREVTGLDPRHSAQASDPSTADTWFPHPVYGRGGWVSVVNPDERTAAKALVLLEAAHQTARVRSQHRTPGQHDE